MVNAELDEIVKQISQQLDTKASELLAKSDELETKVSSLTTDVNNLAQKISDSTDDVKAQIASIKKQNLLLLIVAIVASLLAVLTNFVS